MTFYNTDYYYLMCSYFSLGLGAGTVGDFGL